MLSLLPPWIAVCPPNQPHMEPTARRLLHRVGVGGGHPEQLPRPRRQAFFLQAAEVNQVSRNCHQEKFFIGEHKQDQEMTVGTFQRNGKIKQNKTKQLTRATHGNPASRKQEALPG